CARYSPYGTNAIGSGIRLDVW
nr:immunoglobulin heavy chain junction region [Macaca mulatta]